MYKSIACLVIALALHAPIAHAERAPKLPIKTFAQLPQVSQIDFSPNGDYLAMIRPIKGRNHIVVQHRTNKEDFIIIPPQDGAHFNWFRWINDERLIFSISFQTERNGTPLTETRLLSVKRDGTDIINMVKAKKIGRNAGNSRRATGGLFSQFQDRVIDILRNDPEHFLLEIDEEHDGRVFVRKVNVNDADFSTVLRGYEGIQNWFSDRNGRPRYGVGIDYRYNSAAISKKLRHIFIDENGKMIDLDDPLPLHEANVLGFGADPNTLLLEGWDEKGRFILARYKPLEGLIEPVFERDNEDFAYLITDPYTSHPTGARGVKMDSPIVWLDDDYSKVIATLNKALPDSFNDIEGRDDNGNFYIVYSESRYDPGYFYVYDSAEKKLHNLMEKYPGLDPAHLGDVNTFTFTARDGLKVEAVLTTPLGVSPKNLPLVVLPHGGPHSHSTVEYNHTAQFLANRGYAVLEPNFRGSTGYGKAFEEAGHQQWGLAMQDDVSDATQWAIKSGLADPARICIVGASYGGYAALMGAIKEPELYKCAAAFNGVFDLPKMKFDQKDFIGGLYMTRFINTGDTKSVSPYYRADEVTIPVLLLAAKDDRVVRAEQSQDMAKELEKAGVLSKFIQIDDGGHNLNTETARTAKLSELEKFLKENIGH